VVLRDFPHTGSLDPSSAWPCKRLCNAFYVVTVITLFSHLFVRWWAYDNRMGRNAIDHHTGQVLASVLGDTLGIEGQGSV
jgi:hypothetical protein